MAIKIEMFITIIPVLGLIVEGIDSLITDNESLAIKERIANRNKGNNNPHFVKLFFFGTTYNPVTIQIVAAIYPVNIHIINETHFQLPNSQCNSILNNPDTINDDIIANGKKKIHLINFITVCTFKDKIIRFS